MVSMYPACFFKEENGYSVIFPDLNYTATCGETLEEASRMAVDCLAGYLYTAEKDNDVIPKPSLASEVIPSEIAKELELRLDDEAFVNMIAVDVKEYAKTHFEKPVKKTITIPAWLNNAAKEQHLNLSSVLEDALISRLNTSI